MTSATPNATGVDPFFFGRDERDVRDHAPAVAPAASALVPDPDVAVRGRIASPAPPGPARRRRKRWGGDRRTEPLPMVPQPVSERRVAMAPAGHHRHGDGLARLPHHVVLPGLLQPGL